MLKEYVILQSDFKTPQYQRGVETRT